MSKLVSLNAKVSHLVPVVSSTDWELLLTDWLSTKRSPHTQRVYRRDIQAFLDHFDGLTLAGFLSGDRFSGFEVVSRYKGELIAKGLTAATLNRRLSALKSFVSYAYQAGKCEFTLDGVKGEQLKAYRDTTGTGVDGIRSILETCDLTTLAGVRDYAILLLLWGNALRRSEVGGCNIGDFDPQAGTLRILGKGRTQSEPVTLGASTVAAVSRWLDGRGWTDPDLPLFSPLISGHTHRRLSDKSIYNIVKGRALAAGIPKPMSPHRIRHSAITAALDATGGDVRKVQKLSRHKDINTLLIYDDNRVNHQGEITGLLDGLL